MTSDIKKYAKENYSDMVDLLKELCVIPAPSHFEDKRAEFIKKWLEDKGAKGVYIDEAKNVIYPLNCENSNEITVFAAHTDTVFPEDVHLEVIDDGEKLHCPGVSDDTASVVVMLFMAEYFIKNNIVPEKGVMFVANSCEEGLGNLKGTRQLFKDFDGRIKAFISFDCSPDIIYDKCVGSHRYEVEVLTEGGHSFGNFGNDNAIAKIAEIINEIYKIEVPKKEGTRTTYNVGTISGGTSVNTIAQSAKMLCEYRSDDRECLDFMEKRFKEIFEKARTEKIEVKVEKVGDRPCGNIEEEKVDALEEIIVPIIEEIIDKKVKFRSASTDCNIPFSLNVAALCIGVNHHQGVHTLAECMEKESLIPGLEIAIRCGLELIK